MDNGSCQTMWKVHKSSIKPKRFPVVFFGNFGQFQKPPEKKKQEQQANGGPWVAGTGLFFFDVFFFVLVCV